MGNTVLDLRHEFPRSPKETLDGIVHFARIIDKVRAKGAGLIGEYLYPCPLDQMFLAFFKIEAEDFFEAIQNKEDAKIAVWLKKHRVQRSAEEIAQWNQNFLHRKPASLEEETHFLEQRNRLAPERKDVETWVDLLDLDEGRDLPLKNPTP